MLLSNLSTRITAVELKNTLQDSYINSFNSKLLFTNAMNESQKNTNSTLNIRTTGVEEKLLNIDTDMSSINNRIISIENMNILQVDEICVNCEV